MDNPNNQPPLYPTNNTQSGPVFEAAPGWGGRMYGWLESNLEKIVLPVLAIAILLVGIVLYLITKKPVGPATEPIANVTEVKTPLGESIFNDESKVYAQKAKSGQGVTHLARAALSSHLSLNPTSNLTREHMVYIEDYLQNKVGNRYLEVGETLEFSTSDIEEAMGRARKLKPEELENLSKYVKNGPRV